jgi:hypothetical protein
MITHREFSMKQRNCSFTFKLKIIRISSVLILCFVVANANPISAKYIDVNCQHLKIEKLGILIQLEMKDSLAKVINIPLTKFNVDSLNSKTVFCKPRYRIRRDSTSRYFIVDADCSDWNGEIIGLHSSYILEKHEMKYDTLILFSSFSSINYAVVFEDKTLGLDVHIGKGASECYSWQEWIKNGTVKFCPFEIESEGESESFYPDLSSTKYFLESDFKDVPSNISGINSTEYYNMIKIDETKIGRHRFIVRDSTKGLR